MVKLSQFLSYKTLKMKFFEAVSSLFTRQSDQSTSDASQIIDRVRSQKFAMVQAASHLESISIRNYNSVLLKDLPNLSHIYIYRSNLHLVIQNCPRITQVLFVNEDSSQNIIIEYVK